MFLKNLVGRFRKFATQFLQITGRQKLRAMLFKEAPQNIMQKFARIDGLEITALPIPHDATEPVGFLATSVSTGARATICYDIGHVNENVRTLCRESDVLVLEANHDEGMLWAGPYPPWLCQRIAGNDGHLSNRVAGALARDSVTARTAHVVLAHLSQQNNTPEMARSVVRSALRGTSFRGKLTTAPQDGVVGPFMPRGGRVEDPRQYSLF